MSGRDRGVGRLLMPAALAFAAVAGANAAGRLAALGTLVVAIALLTSSVAALRGAGDRWTGGAMLVAGLAGFHLWLVASTGAGCEALLSAGAWLDRLRGTVSASCLGAGDAVSLAGASQWQAIATTAGPLLLVVLALVCALIAPGSAAAVLATLARRWVMVRSRPAFVVLTTRRAREAFVDCARAPRRVLSGRLVERRGPPYGLAAA